MSTTEAGPRWRAGSWPLAAGVLALAACGGDAPERPAYRAVPDSLPGTPADLADALLSPEDLGEGWIDLGALPLDERGLDECPLTKVITAGEDPARRGESQSLYAEGELPAGGREGTAGARALLTGRPDSSGVTGGSSRVAHPAPGRGRP